MGKAVAYGDEWFCNESVGKREDEITGLSTGNQAVPTTEPDWDYNTGKGRWDQSHFVRCILEGLRQVRAKPLNYGTRSEVGLRLLPCSGISQLLYHKDTQAALEGADSGRN